MPLPTTQLLSFPLPIKAAKKKRQKNQLLIKATVHSLFFQAKRSRCWSFKNSKLPFLLSRAIHLNQEHPTEIGRRMFSYKSIFRRWKSEGSGCTPYARRIASFPLRKLWLNMTDRPHRTRNTCYEGTQSHVINYSKLIPAAREPARPDHCHCQTLLFGGLLQQTTACKWETSQSGPV